MSDGGRERASLGVQVWKSSQKWSVQRSAVRSIAWLDAFIASRMSLYLADNFPAAESKRPALSCELGTSQNSIDNVIIVAHVSTEVHVQRAALYLISGCPEANMAPDNN